MFKKDVVLAQEYLGFLLLNLFDLFLTGYIFHHSGQEANGIPALVLKYAGLRGFAIFKFVMLVLIILLCEIISLFNLVRARQVILGASALYVAVVIWEVYLIFVYIIPYLDHPLPAPKIDSLNPFFRAGRFIGFRCPS